MHNLTQHGQQSKYQDRGEQPTSRIPTTSAPVLAKIQGLTSVGWSRWHEVVYFDEGWKAYAGSRTFSDGEIVVAWKYIDEINLEA